MTSIERHQEEILQNQQAWNQKPVLRRIYQRFHQRIADHLPVDLDGELIEIGSGVADITKTIPGCIRTDLFPNPWIDQVENAYCLSFPDQSVRAIILFDVFHHLRFPGTALKEFWRVLRPGGRVIIFDPGMSLVGRLIYGPLHPEPLGIDDNITWLVPDGWDLGETDYYAAQGNAHRIFVRNEIDIRTDGWDLVTARRTADLAYAATGGYSKPQMFPDFLLPAMLGVDAVASLLPGIFTTRLLVVVEKIDIN